MFGSMHVNFARNHCWNITIINRNARWFAKFTKVHKLLMENKWMDYVMWRSLWPMAVSTFVFWRMFTREVYTKSNQYTQMKAKFVSNNIPCVSLNWFKHPGYNLTNCLNDGEGNCKSVTISLHYIGSRFVHACKRACLFVLQIIFE